MECFHQLEIYRIREEGHWGTWKNEEKCADHRYVNALRVRSQKSGDDEKGLTGVELYCLGAEKSIKSGGYHSYTVVS